VTPFQANYLTELTISKLIYGIRPAVRASDLVSDKRSIKRVWREMTTGGYITETGTLVGEATSKAFDEVQDVPIALSELWDKMSTSTAPHIRDLGIIVFTHLSRADKKYIARNRDKYTWFTATTRLFFSEINNTPANLSDGVPGDLGDRFADRFHVAMTDMEVFEEKQYGNVYGSRVILVQDSALREHVTLTRKAEMFADFYRRQFHWAVSSLGIAVRDDVEVFTLDNADLFTSRFLFACIGNDPEKWARRIDDGIEKAATEVTDINNAIERMKRVRDGIINAGGWEAFHTRYKERLNQELENRMAKIPKLAGSR